MNIEACMGLLDNLISKINKIITRKALMKDSITTDRYRDILVEMKQLIRTLFSNAEERLTDLDESLRLAAERDEYPDGGSFMEQAKVTRRYIFSIKDSLKLREKVEIKEEKLDKLKKDIKEKEIEAKRREKVSETKFHGATIELIDRLRDQLRNEGEIKQEVLNLKNELAEIKEILIDIKKTIG